MVREDYRDDAGALLNRRQHSPENGQKGLVYTDQDQGKQGQSGYREEAQHAARADFVQEMVAFHWVGCRVLP